jgi:hypothetical protein
MHMAMISTLSILEIRKLPEGGYAVGEGRSFANEGHFREPFLFACTNISEALAYMKKKLEAAPPK